MLRFVNGGTADETFLYYEHSVVIFSHLMLTPTVEAFSSYKGKYCFYIK